MGQKPAQDDFGVARGGVKCAGVPADERHAAERRMNEGVLHADRRAKKTSVSAGDVANGSVALFDFTANCPRRKAPEGGARVRIRVIRNSVSAIDDLAD